MFYSLPSRNNPKFNLPNPDQFRKLPLHEAVKQLQAIEATLSHQELVDYKRQLMLPYRKKNILLASGGFQYKTKGNVLKEIPSSKTTSNIQPNSDIQPNKSTTTNDLNKSISESQDILNKTVPSDVKVTENVEYQIDKDPRYQDEHRPIKSKKHTRTSLLQRGKRSSQAYNGMCPIPHPTIPSSTYHNYINAEIPDTLRMRQLLHWVTLKTMDSFPSSSSNHQSSTNDIVRKVQADIVESLQNKQLNTSWYSRPETVVCEPKQPHPNNVANKKKLGILKAQLARYKEEEREWKSILEHYQQDEQMNTDPQEFQEGTFQDMLDPEFNSLLTIATTVQTKATALLNQTQSTSRINHHSMQQVVHHGLVACSSVEEELDLLDMRMVNANVEREKKEIKVDGLDVLLLMSQKPNTS
ncbi:Mis12-Mtw1 protein family-domain-containing protein [Globomyces pollinis-pini]|nr:Mis12-Mtw1 protein family-domain-containing protein [Globomyces pollinis-pini]